MKTISITIGLMLCAITQLSAQTATRDTVEVCGKQYIAMISTDSKNFSFYEPETPYTHGKIYTKYGPWNEAHNYIIRNQPKTETYYNYFRNIFTKEDLDIIVKEFGSFSIFFKVTPQGQTEKIMFSMKNIPVFRNVPYEKWADLIERLKERPPFIMPGGASEIFEYILVIQPFMTTDFKKIYD